jgi:uncharacterized membrane protein
MSKKIYLSLTIIVGLFAFFRLVQLVFPGQIPGGIELVTFLPFLFAFVHGSANYGLKNMLVFFAITLVVSNFFENLSILTNFPFGHYDYTNVLGPKLFLVPILISIAYFGYGYCSWTLARVLLGDTQARTFGHLVYTVPLLAGFLMVSWDLTFDPLMANLVKAWTWKDGGSYFGVPFSNFLGWYLTVYIFYQLFALYIRNREKQSGLIKGYWLQAAVVYGLTGLAVVLTPLFYTSSEIFVDAAGVSWKIQDMLFTCALAALFTMVAFTFLSVVKIYGDQR